MGWHQTTGLPVENRPHSKESAIPAWKEKALACALRKKATLFRDANCAVVLGVVRRVITANHPRVVRYGLVLPRRARRARRSQIAEQMCASAVLQSKARQCAGSGAAGLHSALWHSSAAFATAMAPLATSTLALGSSFLGVWVPADVDVVGAASSGVPASTTHAVQAVHPFLKI
jgi:hypothetical protein